MKEQTGTDMTWTDEGQNLIRGTRAWQLVERAILEKRFPQALSIRTPLNTFGDFMRLLAGELLCLKQGQSEPCRSCCSWNSNGHPDLLVSGPMDEAPGIDRCRDLWAEISLRPVVAARRLAVIFNADRLSPGAANSMLKMTEEPPGNAVIIMFHETGTLLPTLRSRTWNLNVSGEEIVAPVVCPADRKEWIEWLRRTAKYSTAQMDLEIQGMVASLLYSQRPLIAEELETFRVYARKGNLSIPMIQDSLFLLLKEEKPIGQLFADFW